MAQPLYIMEAADVRRADEADSSRVFTVDKLTFPELTRMTSDYLPGGGLLKVNHVLSAFDAITPKFSLKGFDLDIIGAFGASAGTKDKWTFAGAIRNKQTGLMEPARATIQGSVTKVSFGEFSVGSMVGTDYEINGVIHFDFSINGKEIWYVDQQERKGRANGVDFFGEVVLALGA